VELFDITFGESHWSACTIGIRMAITPIPTMNEWGFITVAAFMGIAGIWFLRRRQAEAT
jgi:IPTL-CTERM motif